MTSTITRSPNQLCSKASPLHASDKSWVKAMGTRLESSPQLAMGLQSHTLRLRGQLLQFFMIKVAVIFGSEVNGRTLVARMPSITICQCMQ